MQFDWMFLILGNRAKYLNLVHQTVSCACRYGLGTRLIPPLPLFCTVAEKGTEYDFRSRIRFVDFGLNSSTPNAIRRSRTRFTDLGRDSSISDVTRFTDLERDSHALFFGYDSQISDGEIATLDRVSPFLDSIR